MNIRTWITAGVLLAAIIVLPYVAPSSFIHRVLEVVILAVLVLSAQILTGMAGQISVGQGAFAGVGAYTTAILANELGWPVEATLPLAVAAAALLGLLAGLPALRISGMNLALITLAIAMVFPTFVVKFGGVTGGVDGVRVPTLEAPPWFWSNSAVWKFTVLCLLAVAAFAVVRNLSRGTTGAALRAISENELLAASMGVNIRRYKLVAFVLSSGCAGLAGWMLAMHTAFLSPAEFTLFLSISVVIGMMVGGNGVIVGPLAGALFLVFIDDAAKLFSIPFILVPLVEGVVLIVLLKFLPGGVSGIVGMVGRARRRGAGIPPPFVQRISALMPRVENSTSKEEK